MSGQLDVSSLFTPAPRSWFVIHGDDTEVTKQTYRCGCETYFDQLLNRYVSEVLTDCRVHTFEAMANVS